jgi:hypothetical protein
MRVKFARYISEQLPENKGNISIRVMVCGTESSSMRQGSWDSIRFWGLILVELNLGANLGPGWTSITLHVRSAGTNAANKKPMDLPTIWLPTLESIGERAIHQRKGGCLGEEMASRSGDRRSYAQRVYSNENNSFSPPSTNAFSHQKLANTHLIVQVWPPRARVDSRDTVHIVKLRQLPGPEKMPP